MVWLVILGMLVLLLAALWAPFRVEVQLRKNKREDFLALKYGLGPWEFFQFKVTSLFADLPALVLAYVRRIDPDQAAVLPRPLAKYKRLVPPHFAKVFSRQGLLKKAGIRQLEWSTRVGIANPAVTGMVAGCLWFLKFRLYRYLVEATAGVTAAPRFSVVPDFQETTLDVEFRCIFALRGGHIITAACRTAWIILCSFLRGEKVE